jgi:hypothetical protein
VDERRCPRCDTPVAQGQEYCLECGAPLPVEAGLVAALGSAWRRRLGWYPGDWIWPALLALAVAAVAAVASAIWLTDRSSSANGTLVRTDARPAPPEQTRTGLQPPTTTGAPSVPANPAGPTAPSGPVSTKLAVWPSGKSGWTIVLDSVPAINGRTGAIAEAKQALRLGLKQVGVIDSAQFSSLHPGYLVVFAGIYDTQAAAQGQVVNAHLKGYRGPYTRQIVP